MARAFTHPLVTGFRSFKPQILRFSPLTLHLSLSSPNVEMDGQTLDEDSYSSIDTCVIFLKSLHRAVRSSESLKRKRSYPWNDEKGTNKRGRVSSSADNVQTHHSMADQPLSEDYIRKVRSPFCWTHS